jgi:TonB family protein
VRSKIAVAALLFVSTFFLAPGRMSAQVSAEPVRKIVSKIVPQYPPLARTMSIQGVVRADVLVAPNGTVKSVEVKGGHPLLCQAAQEALRQWKWSPAPHESHESVELRFNP